MALPGDPVGIRVTIDGSNQYAWVAIRNPAELIVIDVGNGKIVDTVSLPGVPIALTIGLAPGALFPGAGGIDPCDKNCPARQSGFAHVLVAE